jgi:hypothetical protein
MKTYHGHAMAGVDDERGGRYASESKPSVIGARPISYPRMPAGSPWRQDMCPPEPPLGIDINAVEAVGEPFEVAASVGAAAASDTALESRSANVPVADNARVARRFKRRF